MIDVLNRGGEFMWVILAASVAVIAIVGERAYVLWRKWALDGVALLEQIKRHIEQEDSYSKALKLCADHPDHPVSRVMQAGLVKANQPDREIQRAIEEAAVRELPRVQVRTGYVSMLANVATLLGLLGTIFGLIDAFKSVGAATAAMKQELLAKGISVAMFTTAFGLLVAIPAMVAFSVLSARQTRIMDSVEESAIGLFNFLSTRNRRIRELGPEAFAALAAEAGGNGGLPVDAAGEAAPEAAADAAPAPGRE